MIPYWECTVHKCGSTKFNNLSRHAWDACDILKKSGNPPSNTWHDEKLGGLNGDISRKFYKDWDAHCLSIQQKIQKAKNWVIQYEANEDK